MVKRWSNDPHRGGAAGHDAARFAGQGPPAELLGRCPAPSRRPNRDYGPQDGAAEELLGNYAISARRLQPLMGELRAIGRATAELLGTARLGITDCGTFKGHVIWRSSRSCCDMTCDCLSKYHGRASRDSDALRVWSG